MSRLAYLISLCQAEVSVTINAHKNNYESVQDWLSDRKRYGGGVDWDEGVLKEMIERDTIVDVQAYSDTPVGSYTCMHWDLDVAIETVIGWIEADRKEEWREN